jgi:hypothetical protein
MSTIHPLRVILKAGLLLALANLAFVYFPPPIGHISIFNRLIPGRLRFNAQVEAATAVNRDALVFEDLDAMFASHVLSAAPKRADEYRVILLGDSSIWGFNLPPAEILSEQINRLGLVACDGRKVTAYDLAYPLPSFMRDLLILDQAVKYEPDLVVWPVTLLSFLTRRSDLSFLRNQPDRVLEMVGSYGLRVEAAPYLHARTFWDGSLYGQRIRIKKILIEQLYGLRWAATGMDAPPPESAPLPEDVDPNPAYYEFASAADAAALAETLQFQALEAGYGIAGGTPILIVNEPIYAAGGANRDIRYNKYYPRWAYDDYRRRIADWMRLADRPYLDLWDAIPPGEFIGSPLHLSRGGESELAGLLAPEIYRLSCP